MDAFLAAARQGDFEGLLAVVDPDIILRADRFAMPGGVGAEVHGSAAVARRAMVGHRPGAQTMLVNGSVGVAVVPRGQLEFVLAFRIVGDKIVEFDVIGDPERLAQLDLAILAD